MFQVGHAERAAFCGNAIFQEDHGTTPGATRLRAPSRYGLALGFLAIEVFQIVTLNNVVAVAAFDDLGVATVWALEPISSGIKIEPGTARWAREFPPGGRYGTSFDRRVGEINRPGQGKFVCHNTAYPE
jgi:hypothetical protein